jgi:DNA modification methylase
MTPDPATLLAAAAILRGNALTLPLADDSVDLVVTSPPYFGLRSYQDGGEHYSGQIGDEPTQAEFVDALIAATAEMVRVLKPSGSIWVNLGDKYAQRTAGLDSRTERVVDSRTPTQRPQTFAMRRNGWEPGALREKSLIGIPWRYAIRCIDDLGLILRAEVIWSKPNGLPESVTDRVRRSHETWFHFTKEPRYYSAVDEIREQSGPDKPGGRWQGLAALGEARLANPSNTLDTSNPLGKLPSSVWEIKHDSESVVRHVLSAISTGSLTIDEGERILTGVRQWTGSNGSGSRSTSPANAGSGLPAEPPRDTASSGSTARQCSHTVSPTRSSTEPRPTSSTSTTSAASGIASGTSSPSPSAKTSCEDQRHWHPSTPPRPTVETGTSSTPSTPTSCQATEAECAASACEQATAAPTGERRPPQADGPGSVWTIPTEPLHVPEHLGIDHFAAFPTAFPRRIIQGWSPSGICTACGEGRRPVVEAPEVEQKDFAATQQLSRMGRDDTAWKRSTLGYSAGRHAITGESCACGTQEGAIWIPATTPDRPPTASATSTDGTPATTVQPVRATALTAATTSADARATAPPTRPAVVLDPFGGTGTVALVAHALGRHAVSVDMSADYCRLATWRTGDPKQQAKAARREYVPPREQTDGQLSLMDGLIA